MSATPSAAPLLDHVDQMTNSRDREQVDATLLGALLDLLPEVGEARLWRVLGEPGAPLFWRPCGAHRRGVLTPVFTPVAQADLLPLEALPHHAECLSRVRPVRWGDATTAVQPVRMALPMASGHETDGVLELISPAPLEETTQRLAQGLLRLHRNFLGLLDYSERDTLTALLNRKSFDETFLKATALEAARLYGPDSMPEPERRRLRERRHWLAVLDIDHFKRVNDLHGHLMGDEVLVTMARVMRASLRYDDRLYRFGGEEFVVLLTAPDEATAELVLERLRGNIEAATFPAVGRVTASLGYSDVRPGDTPQAAFDRADRAVYHAKQNGRNQVCAFAQLVAGGSEAPDPGVGAIELF